MPDSNPGNVAKIKGAPVTPLIAHDVRWFKNLLRLFPHRDMASPFKSNPEKADIAGAQPIFTSKLALEVEKKCLQKSSIHLMNTSIKILNLGAQLLGLSVQPETNRRWKSQLFHIEDPFHIVDFDFKLKSLG